MPRPRRSIDCDFCGVREACFFDRSLPEDVLAELRRERQSYEFAPEEFLFHAGEEPAGLWLICTGRVKIFKQSAEGRPLTVRMREPGEVVGHRAFFANQPYGAYAQAVTPTVASFVPARVVESLLYHHGEMAVRMVRKLAIELGESESFATDLAYRPARQRILDILYELHEARQVADAGNPDAWKFELRRRDLAELLGLTVETTVRTLKKLEGEGVVALHGRTIELLQPGEAEAAAEA